ncbi:MAG: hypothetical protein ABI837_19545 [Acidobacteriota bacterium]
MTPQLHWHFIVDANGRARPANADATVIVETVVPGEYLVTLPLPLYGLSAHIGEDSGFLAAAPGDDAGNKPRVVRVLTLTPQATFGPSDFTLVVGV